MGNKRVFEFGKLYTNVVYGFSDEKDKMYSKNTACKTSRKMAFKNVSAKKIINHMIYINFSISHSD